MSYKKKCNSIKGVHLSWNNNHAFPIYNYNSGPIVSNKILKRAKDIVIHILTHERKKIEKAFTFLAKR